MTAIKDSSALRSVLSYLEDSQPRALVALAQSGRIKGHLEAEAERVETLAAKLAEQPHPMFKDRKLGYQEAEMEALAQLLTSEEEDPDPDDLRAAVKVADRIREMLESES